MLQITELEETNSDLEDSNTKLEASVGHLTAELQAARAESAQVVTSLTSLQEALEQAQKHAKNLEANVASLKVSCIPCDEHLYIHRLVSEGCCSGVWFGVYWPF